MTCPLSLSLSVSLTQDDPSSGGAPPSTDSQPISENTEMDLGWTEVSDILPSLSSMLLFCNRPPLSTSVHYICMHLVLRMVLHMVVIQCLDSFPFHFCSLTTCHVSCMWYCGTYQLWSTGSQLCMQPVCHSDGLFISTGCGTPSAVPTHACTHIVLSLPLLAFHGHVVHVWSLLDACPRSGDP